MLTNRLDTYLNQLEQGLHSLPEAQRQEELTEMRGHLEEMIAAYQEMGLSEEQALIDAEQQFGDMVQLSRDIKKVCRKSFAPTAVESFGAFLGLYAMANATGWVYRQIEFITAFWWYTLSWGVCLLEGIALGRITRRAYWAIGGLLTFSVFALAVTISLNPDISSRLFWANFPYHIAFATWHTVGAYIGSRWQQRRQKSKQVFV